MKKESCGVVDFIVTKLAGSELKEQNLKQDG